MGAATGQLFPPKLARILSSAVHKRYSATNCRVKSATESRRPIGVRAESRMEEASGSGGQGKRSHSNRVPLAEVVSDCVKRWFQDTLKEAKAGDSAMQVLVGQMYYSGYGVTKDVNKGRVWINKASRVRASVWKVSEKRPGYNASDSDSDDTKVDAE